MPRLDIDTAAIAANARVVRELCAQAGIELAGVTKSALGSPQIARAMLDARISTLADSRLPNLARLRGAFPDQPTMLLRPPAPAEARAAVSLASISLVSERETLAALSDAAGSVWLTHRVILMLDLGDLREGLRPDELLETARYARDLPHLELYGLGTNLACLRGVLPSRENMDLLCSMAQDLRGNLGVELPLVSGGNTFCLPLLEDGLMPRGVNHLRVGAAIILAAAPTPPKLRSRLSASACVLSARIVELREKGPRPDEVLGLDAFGHSHASSPEGTRLRALLAVGREDIVPEDLFPLDPGAKVLGASSDHLAVDVGDCERRLKVGDTMSFTLEYGAFLAAMTSPYVTKKYHNGAAR